VRLFIALYTPRHVRTEAGAARTTLAASGADVRWEPDEKLHCTLKFLGETDPSNVGLVVSTIESIAATVAPFEVQYRGLGCFPDSRNPRIIWLGMENADGKLTILHDTIEESLASTGVQRDDRPFHPHLTLGRVRSRHRIGDLLRMMETLTFIAEPATLQEVHLMKSELKPAGSVYTILNVIPLKGK
jgi:2'-5' RNA ligase